MSDAIYTDDKFIIDDDGNIKPVYDLLEWARWYEENRTGKCNIARDEVNGHTVSTVFLALDYNFSKTGDPILFETMAFCMGEGRSYHCPHHEDHPQERYRTKEEALAGHARMVEEIKSLK